MKPEQYLTADDVLQLLRTEIAKAGNQTEWARAHKVDRTRVSAALSGSRSIPRQIAKALGLKPIVVYERA